MFMKSNWFFKLLLSLKRLPYSENCIKLQTNNKNTGN